MTGRPGGNAAGRSQTAIGGLPIGPIGPIAPPAAPEAALRSVHTTNLPALFDRLGISLLVSTYQAGKLIMGLAMDQAGDTQSALTARGHKLIDKPRYLGDCEGIMIEEKTGIRLGATDPRRSDGPAVGY